MQKDDMIYRQEAIDALAEALKQVGVLDMEDVELILSALPAVQFEIIRCEECLMHGVCRFEQGLGLNGYCSQVKRRE